MENARKNLLRSAMDTVAACMQPVIPVLVGCGIIKLLVLVLGMTGVFSYLGQTEELLGYIDGAPFYFLPMLLAYAAAVRFGCNPCYAIASVAVMLLPDFTALVDAAERITFLGLPVRHATYAYGVIPVIVLTYLIKWLQHFSEKWIPAAARSTFAPVVVILLGGVLGIVIVGPAISLLSGLVTDGMSYLQVNYPVVAWMTMCFILPLLLITGTHWIFVSIALEQLGTQGMENGFHVSCFILSMALAGTCLAVFLKSRGRTRETALSVGTTVFTTGISEPALFGICLPFRTPLVATMVAGAIAGIWQGLHNLHSYVYAAPGILSFLMFSSPQEPNNLPGVLIAGAIGFVAALLITLAIYREEKV